MAPIVSSIEIDRKPDDVFAYFDDLAHYAKIQGHLQPTFSAFRSNCVSAATNFSGRETRGVNSYRE